MGANDTDSSPVEVMRREEAARLLALNHLMRWLSVFMLATLPFFGGTSVLRYILMAGLAIGIPGGFVFGHMIRSQGGVTKGVLVFSALAIGVNLYVGILYFGVFSGATSLIVLGLFIASRTAYKEVGLVLYLLYAIAQGAFGSLIIFNVMDDPGIMQMTDRPLFEEIVILVLIEGMFLAGYLLGRAARQISIDAMNEAEEARRKVGQRDALLREARQDLDHALLQVGGPGHYTEQRIGSYVLGIVIGRGGMAEVYEAQNLETGEEAAVKLLHQNLLVQPKAVTRFLREAKAASALDTPHVARILDSSEAMDVLPYLAMERLKGHDLAHYLRHKPVMSMKKLLELVEQVAKVVDLANDAGIVHRDLKPQNIFLAEQGRAKPIWKVLDFGVSVLGEGSGTLTQGSIVGTPAYMSPEQARGGKVDQRTDIHALACIAYRCLTGRPPFSGKDIPSIMYSAVHSMPEAPSIMTDVPKEIDSVIAVGLAKSADDRFESAADFSFKLQCAAKGELHISLKKHADGLLEKLPWGGEVGDD
jgi:serine/threonine-protein kinase